MLILKDYQQQVIADLNRYVLLTQTHRDISKAFRVFWNEHPHTPIAHFVKGKAVETYKNNIKGVPHVCLKVPTGGGKTLIACHAVRTILEHYDSRKARAVVWMVPSEAILTQTINALRDPDHNYRKQLDIDFGSRVEVLDKNDLLQGVGINSSSVHEQLTVFVLMFQSFRSQNKEGRKAYEENSVYQSYSINTDAASYALEGTDETASINVLRSLNPLVIVDESHKSNTVLSVEMLANLNPSFVLDLTATPRSNSNMLSFIDASALKRANMVKLPLIAYNLHDRTAVINSALELRSKLEKEAKQLHQNGGKYIRPIILFQAQPKNAEDEKPYRTLKNNLIAQGIAEMQIKIKVNQIDELKGINLLSESCEVRYIITVDALNEGWDCPFAYILASLANKTSAVAVEQVIGRVLRLPYTRQHAASNLNMGYVLTASERFNETLENIIKGLNNAGFSRNDFKAIDDTATKPKPAAPEPSALPFGNDISPPNSLGANAANTGLLGANDENTDENDLGNILVPTENETEDNANTNAAAAETSPVAEMLRMAAAQEATYNNDIQTNAATYGDTVAADLLNLMEVYPIKESLRERADAVQLPQFHLKEAKKTADLMSVPSFKYYLLAKENLLSGFNLDKANADINFDVAVSEIYAIDIDETKKDYAPSYTKVDNVVAERLMEYVRNADTKTQRVGIVAKRIEQLVKANVPAASNIYQYLMRVLSELDEDKLSRFLDKENTYAAIIKHKLETLQAEYAKKKFEDWILEGRIVAQPSFSFAKTIKATKYAPEGVAKSLYEREAEVNGFELALIQALSGLANVVFWTRNVPRTGFGINSYENHYPDFIVLLQSGTIIAVETKGGHLDTASDTLTKIAVGNKWAAMAGSNYRYCMVFEDKITKPNDAFTMSEFIKLVANNW